MKTLAILTIVMSLVLVIPAQAEWARAAQVANTTISIATTDPNVVIDRPDQMVQTLWEAPLVRFPGDEPKWIFIRVKVLPGSNGQFLNQMAPKLEAAARFWWGENAEDKNVQVGKNGSPEPHDYCFDLELSYVVGQNQNQSQSGGSNNYNSRNGSYGESRSDSQTTVTQESHLSLTAELVEYYMRGNNDGVIAPSSEISAYENGTISASGSTSGLNSSSTNGRGRDFFGYRTCPSSYNDQHFESWSWANSGTLLEEKSAEALAKYLVKGAYARVCQYLAAKQAKAAVSAAGDQSGTNIEIADQVR